MSDIETISGYTTFTHDGSNMIVASSNTFTVTMGTDGHFTTREKYSRGTKLLRDAAQRADEYCRKKNRSRSGWKTRREIRDV